MSIVRDHYFKKAKSEGYRARSAYKLIETNKKYRLLKSDDFVLDIGAAPGSWLQFVAPIIGEKGLVIGIDLESIVPLPGNPKNVKTAALDIFNPEVEQKILALSGDKLFDVILSDAAPKTTGQKEFDQELSRELVQRVFELAERLLKPGGNMAVKMFEGPDVPALVKEQRTHFCAFKIFKPLASKKASKEIYLVGLDMRGN